MEPSVWLDQNLSDEILRNDKILTQTQSIIADIVSDRISLWRLLENMRGVLTSTVAENREKGVLFLTVVLQQFPAGYLQASQIKFLSKFYTQRLSDHHTMLPHILEGYLVLIDMKNYDIELCAEFFREMFKNIACQMQSRQDRLRIYQIIQRLFDSNPDYFKDFGIDFPLGVIQAIDGERDPRNLIFIFNFMPRFIQKIPLGHLATEMFSVLSCYFPIDFQTSDTTSQSVTRQQLADSLAPCLCVIPEFGEQCLVLLIEKLESASRVAKIDSYKLLTESCQTFNAETYLPYLKPLWSCLHKEVVNNSDEELKLMANTALSTLVWKICPTANTDMAFENFIKGILISMQQNIASANTVMAYVQATKILTSVANSCKEACFIVTSSMIPASITYYEYKEIPKMQLAALEYLADLYELAKNWDILDVVEQQVDLIPQQCLVAVSQQRKEYQMAGFKTLIRVVNILKIDLVVPFVEILTHVIQHSQDNDLLSVIVQTIHAIARKFPEQIMDLVIVKKCNIDNLTKDQTNLYKRLSLLCSLASIDDFTKIIIEEMLKLIANNNEDAFKVVEALSESLSNSSIYTEEKITEIDSDHGLIDSILTWLLKEMRFNTTDSLTHAYLLISNTMCSLSSQKQLGIVQKHTPELMRLCNISEDYFFILERLLIGLRNDVHDDILLEVLMLSLNLSLRSDNDMIRLKACALSAHFLNKAEFGAKFEVQYELLKKFLSTMSRDEPKICPRLIILYGWVTKAMIMRSSDIFIFWLKKIIAVINNPVYSKEGTSAISVIVTDFPEYFTSQTHCRLSILYKQWLFEAFSKQVEKMGKIPVDLKENYLLSWGLICGKTPKSVLSNEVRKLVPLAIDSLDYENRDLLTVMLDLLWYFIQNGCMPVAESMQSVVPRLMKLSKSKSMEIRIKSLKCIYEIAETYRTSIILPFKQDVLDNLGPALDDKKRLVRNMAVKARTRWFLVGAPGEPKEN